MQTNKSNFVIFYKLLPEKLRPKFLQALSNILELAIPTIYQRMAKEKFSAKERALISYHLGINQKVLFPFQDDIVVVSDSYKAENIPLYKYFFSDHKFEYNPAEIEQVLKSNISSKIYIIL